jgi:hypothetical protein
VLLIASRVGSGTVVTAMKVATTNGWISIAVRSSVATGVVRSTFVLQQGWAPAPMWQLPAIFLQQAISACVIKGFGRQAKAGIAVHAKTSRNANMKRHFAINTCYLSTCAQCKDSKISGLLHSLSLFVLFVHYGVFRRASRFRAQCFT